MPSRFWNRDLAALATRHERFHFDFPARTLVGKVILAPGGAGGLGAATVALLAAEGAQVVVGYRENRARAQKLAQAISKRRRGRVHLVEGDLRQPEARRKLVAQGTTLGDVYGLVNFLGEPARADFTTLDDKAMADSLAINYIAPILLARDVAMHMLKRRVSGSLVFLASMQAVAEFEGSINYAGAKAALVHAARTLARQWGALRVNVVAPGVTVSGMARASIESGKYDPYLRQGVIPRFGRPEDVAHVVRLLLEPDNYLTGQLITVDGGLTLRRGIT